MSDRNYDDIINLPHHVSRRHPQMSLAERAAQFAPFAALVGYDAAIDETSRFTENRRSLDEDQRQILDYRLQTLIRNADSHPRIRVEYFKADERKQGGAYHILQGRLHSVSTKERIISLENGQSIAFADIAAIDILPDHGFRGNNI